MCRETPLTGSASACVCVCMRVFSWLICYIFSLNVKGSDLYLWLINTVMKPRLNVSHIRQYWRDQRSSEAALRSIHQAAHPQGCLRWEIWAPQQRNAGCPLWEHWKSSISCTALPTDEKSIIEFSKDSVPKLGNPYVKAGRRSDAAWTQRDTKWWNKEDSWMWMHFLPKDVWTVHVQDIFQLVLTGEDEMD